MKTNKINFISDKSIISWNDKIFESRYTVRPEYRLHHSIPEITIWQKSGMPPYGDKFEQTIDPHIEYRFTFSVSSNRTEQFFEILSILMERPFHNKFSYKEQEKNIDITDSIIANKTQQNHKLLNREYTRYSYEFSGRLTSIMAYVSIITDAIHFFQMIWGYDENGNEHCLLNYSIGTIVSTPNDKSKDYLVLDYIYIKSSDDKYEINYVCSEMLNTDSSIIEYGETKIYNESEICFSRNNRIDDILN